MTDDQIAELRSRIDKMTGALHVDSSQGGQVPDRVEAFEHLARLAPDDITHTWLEVEKASGGAPSAVIAIIVSGRSIFELTLALEPGVTSSLRCIPTVDHVQVDYEAAGIRLRCTAGGNIVLDQSVREGQAARDLYALAQAILNAINGPI